VLVSMAYTGTVAFTDVAGARQKQAATGLVNRTVEQIRAMPFDLVKRGLATSDLTSDTLIVNCPSGGADAGFKCFEGERLSSGGYTNTAGQYNPLNPHKRDVPVGGTNYHLSVYVTYATGTGVPTSANVFRVTVIAAWDNPARRGTLASVRSSTLVHSPEGCTSTATHPFSAPCQAFLYAVATAQPGSVDISGTLPGGSTFGRASLRLPDFASVLQVEQLSAAQNTGRTAGGTLTDLNGATSNTGYQAADVSADDDPGSVGATAPAPASASNGAQGSISSSGGPHSVRISPAVGDASAAASVSKATSADSCTALDGSVISTSLPCGQATFAATSSTRAELALSGGTSVPLVTFSPAASSAGKGHTRRTIAGSGACAGDGCVTAEARRSFSSVRIGGTPTGAGVAIAGCSTPFQYLIEVSNYSEQFVVSSGIAAPGRTGTTPAGTVTFWNGCGYTTRSLPTGTSTTAALRVNTGLAVFSASGVTVRFEPAVFDLGGRTVTETLSGANRTVTEVLARPPVASVGNVGCVISDASGTTNLSLAVNLGNLQAKATYAPGPSS
jgi:hypothetical protein